MDNQTQLNLGFQTQDQDLLKQLKRMERKRPARRH